MLLLVFEARFPDCPARGLKLSELPSSNWCRKSVGGESRFGRITDCSQPSHACVQNYLNYLARRHTHIFLLCFNTREVRWSVQFSRSIVSGKLTLQINLPVSFKLNVQKCGSLFDVIIIIIIINIKDWTLWSVPSSELQLLAPTLLRCSNCSPSFWSLVVWFQRDSVLWYSLQVWKPVPPVFIYLV